MLVTVIPIVAGVLGTIFKGLVKRLKLSRDHPTTALSRSASILRKVGDLRRFTVTQIPMRNHQLILE